MVRFRSDYPGELAVVFAWLAALLPWNVTYSTLADLGSVLFVRFPFVQVRYAFGIPIADAVAITTPLGALALQQGQTVAVGYRAWAVGAVVVGAAVVLSVLLYRDEERIEARMDAVTGYSAVRAMGAILALAAVVFTSATWLLWTRGFPGLQLPLGVVLLYVFGGTLLLVRRE